MRTYTISYYNLNNEFKMKVSQYRHEVIDFIECCEKNYIKDVDIHSIKIKDQHGNVFSAIGFMILQ